MTRAIESQDQTGDVGPGPQRAKIGLRPLGPLRLLVPVEVAVVGDRLEYLWTTVDRAARLEPVVPDLLKGFVALGDLTGEAFGKAVQGFASRHGVFGECRHARSRRGCVECWAQQLRGVEPQGDGRAGSDCLETWTRRVHEVRSFRRAAEALLRGRRPDIGDSAEVGLIPCRGELEEDVRSQWDEHGPTVKLQRTMLTVALDVWAERAGTEVTTVWGERGPRQELALHGLFGAIVELLRAELCSSIEDRRTAVREAQQKRRDAMREARALAAGGTPILEIAGRLGRSQEVIAGWIRTPRGSRSPRRAS